MNSFINTNFISGLVGNMIEKNIEEKPKNVYSTKEVAQILNMSEYTVRKKIRNKEIDAIKEDGELKYKITREAIEKYTQNELNKLGIKNNDISNENKDKDNETKSIVEQISLTANNAIDTANNVIDNASKFIKSLASKSINEKINQIQTELIKNKSALKIKELEHKKFQLTNDKSLKYKIRDIDFQIEIEKISSNVTILEKELQILEQEQKKESNT